MATKLKNLKVKKVDFVDEGANPDADIKLYKRKDDGKTSEKGDSDKESGFWKRLISVIGKAARMDQGEIDSVMEEIQKSEAVSFGEKFNEVKNRQIADEIWDICYALQSSLCSILNDDGLDGTGVSTAMKESLDEFHAVVQEAISQWSVGKATSIVRKNEEVTEGDLEIMKAAVERLTESIKKAATPKKGLQTNCENPKGEYEMKIDKSKLTPEELSFLESIEKRYGTDDAGNATEPDATLPVLPEVNDSVVKAAASQTKPTVIPQNTDGTNVVDDIYKGIHPEVKAELEALKKFREEAEDRELAQVAKKYEIIGRKSEELVPMLKSLKAAGGTAYNDMIAILDQSVEVIEKSGAFSEIGKSGHGSNGNSAEAKASTIAKKLMEEDPALSYQQAVAKAWENHPELLAEYDEQEGF